MRHTTILLILGALLLASCGSAGPEVDSTDVIEQVLAPTTQPDLAGGTTLVPDEAPPPTTAPSLAPGCRLSIELDEYDFEIEVVRCDDEPPDDQQSSKWIGSNEARRASTLIREAMIGQTSCGETVIFGELRDLIGEAAPKYRNPLLAAVAELELAAAACDTRTDDWAAAMSAAIFHLEDFLRTIDEAGLS